MEWGIINLCDYKSMCKSWFAKDKQKIFCAVTPLLMHVVIKDLLKQS